MATSAVGHNGLSDERVLALDRVLQSRTFSNARALREILKYVVERSVSGDIDAVKEYSIATEALGRPLDFNPKADNIVRVQMQRLRRKLQEYYNNEGSEDPVRILIPVGHYTPQYRVPASLDLDKPCADAGASKSASRKIGRTRARWVWKVLAAASIVLNLAFAFAVFEASRPAVKAEAFQERLPGTLVPLWAPFVTSNSPPPLVVYGNPWFLRTKQGDLYWFPQAPPTSLSEGTKVSNLAGFERASPLPPHLGPLYYDDAYAGIGEVVAAARVSQLLSAHCASFSIQRSAGVSIEDIRASNVIFLGSAMEDWVLGELPVKTQLVFVYGRGTQRWLTPVIQDALPSAGQHTTYAVERDPSTGALQGEYALISLLPGLDPSRRMMVLAGLSTLGTEAAAEFATSPQSMDTLERMREAASGAQSRSPYFQALLHVVVRSGAVAQINCISVRILSQR